MVFTPTNLHKSIPCPGIQLSGHCDLCNCIFLHEKQETQSPLAELHTFAPAAIQAPCAQNAHPRSIGEPVSKRRKLDYVEAGPPPQSKADVLRSNIATIRSEPPTKNSVVDHKPPLRPGSNNNSTSKQPATLERPVSPPGHTIRSTVPSTSLSSLPAAKEEVLNPRLLAVDPAGHAKRTLFLKHLHAALAMLNQVLADTLERQSGNGLEANSSCVLSEVELIKLALDEEEKIAKEQGLVYANVIKNRIASYKKMKMEDWLKQRKDSHMPANQKLQNTSVKAENSITTGLSSSEECEVLKLLIVADQISLSQFGYVVSPPSEVAAKEAAFAAEKSLNYEECERCAARFQVFPSRNAEGLLTGQGKCRYHPKRKINPQRTKADTGHKEPYYPCCNEVVGSLGCDENDHHVFKASAPARLAAVLPFITTPDNPNPAKDKNDHVVEAVAFDCEMGYTTLGLELIRLTALSWPLGETLVDVLVRPLGIVLDLNSQFSGVLPEHFLNATPYSVWRQSARATQAQSLTAIGTMPVLSLPVVENPQAARALLCSFLSPQTPLIGHAIDNDLNAVRLCHPSIVDTIVLFPHHAGLPYRLGLRALAQRHLRRYIQQSSKHGHDSSEDAKATADLVRVAVRECWKSLSGQGFKFVDGKLISQSPSVHLTKPILPWQAGSSGSLNRGKKRSRKEVSTDDEEGTKDDSTLKK